MIEATHIHIFIMNTFLIWSTSYPSFLIYILSLSFITSSSFTYIMPLSSNPQVVLSDHDDHHQHATGHKRRRPSPPTLINITIPTSSSFEKEEEEGLKTPTSAIHRISFKFHHSHSSTHIIITNYTR